MIACQLKGIDKQFGGSKVLYDINLELHTGEVHGLVGENGAGKSTVGKIIGGYYTKDNGVLEIFGETVHAWDSRRALTKGVAMIHQELQLVPELSVANNVFLGKETNRLGVLQGSERSRFDELEFHCQFGIRPDVLVKNLSIADRQKVEIMRALARDARIIIMDEPTSSLTADEAERLHGVIKWLKDSGRTVIYVSHFLEHVLSHCDRVTVMRDGHIVKTSFAKEETKNSLVEAMLGQAIEVSFPERSKSSKASAPYVLEVKNVSTATGLENISLNIRAGEIVGLMGLVGSGRSELARAIFGADVITSGQVFVKGSRYEKPSPNRSVELGLVMLPEDRRKQGLVMTRPVRPNMSLPHLDVLSRVGVIDQAQERLSVKTLIEHFSVNPAKVDGDVSRYSGGNQQKVLLAKWFFNNPSVVILDEPSRGVDVGARRKIHDLIVEVASRGSGVLLISSELEEVLGLAHRAYLLSEVRIIGEVDATTVSQDDVLFRLFNVDREPSSRVSA